MIGYLEGTLLRHDEERLLVLVGGIGYEVLVPALVMETLGERRSGEPIALHIFFYQTERQPKPVLIGFTTALEKEFFQLFITVEDIGPLKAAKALTMPVAAVARAIEAGDTATLRRLKGIGERTAGKIVAALGGKLDRFLADGLAKPAGDGPETPVGKEGIAAPVLEVLVNQLGHRLADARRLVTEALLRNSAIRTPEELFDEVYRGQGRP
jgi:Holliday junction DNA helicase RuvA